MNNSIEPRHPVSAPPIHPMAALTTLVLDNIFGVVEILDPLVLTLTSIGVGLIGFTTTTFVQRFLAKDSWGTSVAKGLVLGVIAGVPYQVAGTVIGVPLLAWAGLHQIKLPPLKNHAQPPVDIEKLPASNDRSAGDENQ